MNAVLGLKVKLKVKRGVVFHTGFVYSTGAKIRQFTEQQT